MGLGVPIRIEVGGDQDSYAQTTETNKDWVRVLAQPLQLGVEAAKDHRLFTICQVGELAGFEKMGGMEGVRVRRGDDADTGVDLVEPCSEAGSQIGGGTETTDEENILNFRLE